MFEATKEDPERRGSSKLAADGRPTAATKIVGYQLECGCEENVDDQRHVTMKLLSLVKKSDVTLMTTQTEEKVLMGCIVGKQEGKEVSIVVQVWISTLFNQQTFPEAFNLRSLREWDGSSTATDLWVCEVPVQIPPVAPERDGSSTATELWVCEVPV